MLRDILDLVLEVEYYIWVPTMGLGSQGWGPLPGDSRGQSCLSDLETRVWFFGCPEQNMDF